MTESNKMRGVFVVVFLVIITCSNPLDSVSYDQYSLVLSGAEYVEVPYNASLDTLNSDTFTIELYFRADSITVGESPALFMVSNDSGGNEIGIYRNLAKNDRFVVYMDDQPVPDVNNIGIPGFGIQNGEWYFVAVTYDSGEVTLYIDGNQQLSGELSDSTATIDIGSSPVLLGADLDGVAYGNYLEGAFDEVRLWRNVLTPEQIDLHARRPDLLSEHWERGSTPQELLIGLWRFNDGSGTRITDESEYGNHGMLRNTSTGEWISGGMTP